MSDCINREEAIAALQDTLNDPACPIFIAAYVDQILSQLPAADVRPVVTCEECKWHYDSGYHWCEKWKQRCPDNAEFFCAYGERPNCGADMRH